VRLAEAARDGSATLVAVTVIVGGEGGVSGAVYIAASAPVLLIVPIVAFPPPMPLTPQTTERFGLPEPVTMAEKLCVEPTGSVAELGETFTITSLWSKTVDEPIADGSAWLVARTVTLAGEGRICGAAYWPVAEIVPTAAFPPAIPFTLQVTDVLDVPVTVAVNICVCPRNKDAFPGRTLTVIVTGGGGGGGEVPPVLPHPSPQNALAHTARKRNPQRTIRLLRRSPDFSPLLISR
jgi:hypothetical protein